MGLGSRYHPGVSGLTIAPLGWAQGDDARWHRIYAVAGFLKSGDLWVANCSTSVTPSESALLQEIPTGGVCPTCRHADNDVALAIDHLLL